MTASRLCLLLIPLTFLNAMVLAADDGPVTVLEEGRLFVTTGGFTIPVDPETAEAVLTDYPRYREWALWGMAGEEPGDDWHIAWLQDCLWEPETGTMRILYGIHLLGALRSRNNSLRFLAQETRDPQGRLTRLTFSLYDRNPFLRRADYGVELAETPEGIRISYFGQVQLTPLIGIFFTLKTYEKNIAWYMIRLVRNYRNRLTGIRQDPLSP